MIAGFFGVTTDFLFDYHKQSCEVKVIKPATYEDTDKILELLQKSTTVIINFDETGEELKNRL